ncbi:hypothetical protein OAJ04_02145 [Candidatus Nitrosopelagicus sp.]|nr:hypothetical protein [Candidatus Nitrosopelagicus sp.]
MENSQIKKKIILLDSIESIESIEKELIKLKDAKIITFDYVSHKSLLKTEIEHEISDDFLDEKEYESIQKKSMSLTKWYDGELSKLLEYEKVNLGRIFYVEFHHYLLQILKKTLETKRIVNEFQDVDLIASPKLFNIAKEFHSSVTLFDIKMEKKDDFLDDSIKFRLTNSMKFDLSRKSYQKLKVTSEKIFSNIRSNQMKNEEKSVLFVEFDPIKYEELFKISKEHPLNFILFNRRRPSIWNLKSYKIIKNSNCIIANADDVLDENTNNIIREQQEEIVKKIEKLWNREEFFESFFVFNKESFWKIIKNDFLKLCTIRMKDAVNEINITKKIFEKFKISSIICWSENGLNEQIAISLGKNMKKRIFLLQHGLYADSIDSIEQNEFSGVLPNNSNNFLVWGNIMEKYIKNIQFSETKMEIIGSPSYDSIIDNEEHEEKHILIATTSTSNKIGDFIIRDREDYEKTILKICQSLENMGKEIIIKIHPFEEERYVTELVKKINPKISVIKKGSIVPLIKSCEVFISLNMSTTILEAQLLKKPVISINTGKIPYNDESSIFKSNSCDRVKIEEFDETITKILHDNDYKSDLIKRGTDFFNEYVSNQGKASEKLFSYLKNFNN